MRVVLVLVAMLALMGKVAGAEQPPANSNFSRVTKVAQSYCAICGNQRTDCVLRCNGSGACIQSCDDDYQLCVERACRR